MQTDNELAQSAVMLPISAITEKLSLVTDSVENFGKYKAKNNLSLNPQLSDKPNGTHFSSPQFRQPARYR